ncbi:MAG: TonB-dependent receptor, partial [Acetobacteraceae bacterium]|nr:TonB-dependent receptor [Acetobacteraceae bacterium]
MANLSYQKGDHTLSAGIWIERTAGNSRNANYNQAPPNGKSPPLTAPGPFDLYGPPIRITNLSRWRVESIQAFGEYVYRPSEKLSVRAGVKAVDFKTSGGGIGPDEAPNGVLRTREAFLPQLEVAWRPTNRSAFFLELTRTAAGFRVAARGNIGPVSSAWAVDSQKQFDNALPVLKPETAWQLTTGASYDFGKASISLGAYYAKVANRLLNGTSGPQFAPVRSVGVVPRSQLLGADARVMVRPWNWLTASQSVSISKFKYLDDLVVDGETQPLKGRFQPGYAGLSLITDVTARYQRVEAGLNSTYYADQPFTYSNDIFVPSFWQVNARASYTLPA